MRYALLSLLAFFSLACNSIQQPTATVRNASLGQVTPESITLNLDLLVSNPNHFALPVTNTDYSLSVANARLFDGKAEPQASIPAGGSAPLTIPIRIKWEDLLKAKEAIASSRGNLPYTIAGKLNLGSGMALLGDRASVPLSYSGTLPLRDALADPKIILNSPAAQQLARYALSQFGF